MVIALYTGIRQSWLSLGSTRTRLIVAGGEIVMRRMLFALGLLIATPSHAAPELTPKAVPYDLHVYNETGNTFVRLLPSGCSGKTYYIPFDHSKYDTIMAMLLAAQLSGREVQGRFDGCNSNGQGRIVGVYIK